MTREEALRQAKEALAEALDIPEWRDKEVRDWLGNEESLEHRSIPVNGQALKVLVEALEEEA